MQKHVQKEFQHLSIIYNFHVKTRMKTALNELIVQAGDTIVMSREAAAALMWRLGWRTVLVQSNARANVPIDLHTKTANNIAKIHPQTS